MKKTISSIAICFPVIVLAQNPTLSLVGGSPSFTKGTIDTEVLTEIIQQKQEEVKKKVFRNTIVKEFNNFSYTERLRNFTTYYYMYNLMDAMTSGKNKTAITKSIVESSTEFAYVYGFALYVNNSYQKEKNSIQKEQAKIKFERNLIKIKNVTDFNMTLDICYDVILNNSKTKNLFKFEKDTTDIDFKIWYQNDNCYIKAKTALDGITKNKNEKVRKKKDYISTLKYTGIFNNKCWYGKNSVLNDSIIKSNNIIGSQYNYIETKYTEFLENITELNKFYNLLKDTAYSKEKIVKQIIDSIQNLTNEELKNRINKIHDSSKKDTLLKFVSSKLKNYDNIKQVAGFYKELKKSNFQDFTLNKEQYYSMKYILTDFLKLAKNQYRNDVVSTVLDFMLENTLVEYSDNNSKILETKVTDNTNKGYLYIDVESLISSINDRFIFTSKKGLGVYVMPFFSIGTNYAYFSNNKNKLAIDKTTGNQQPLYNIYYASEKIGVKYKIWDWSYTHSFDIGENFQYYNKKTTFRYWLRPQPKPTLSDVHLFVYASGLLYNIANLKSDSNFNYPVVGGGVGLTFFNGLTTNFSVACPYADKTFSTENTFLNFGLDIPIVEYIAALKRKK